MYQQQDQKPTPSQLTMIPHHNSSVLRYRPFLTSQQVKYKAAASTVQHALMHKKHWSDLETRGLLELWSQPHMQHELATCRQKRLTWIRVSQMLAQQNGIERDWRQCFYKIHNLSTEYMRVRTGRQSSSPNLMYFHFFDRVKRGRADKQPAAPDVEVVQESNNLDLLEKVASDDNNSLDLQQKVNNNSASGQASDERGIATTNSEDCVIVGNVDAGAVSVVPNKASTPVVCRQQPESIVRSHKVALARKIVKAAEHRFSHGSITTNPSLSHGPSFTSAPGDTYRPVATPASDIFPTAANNTPAYTLIRGLPEVQSPNVSTASTIIPTSATTVASNNNNLNVEGLNLILNKIQQMQKESEERYYANEKARQQDHNDFEVQRQQLWAEENRNKNQIFANLMSETIKSFFKCSDQQPNNCGGVPAVDLSAFCQNR